jgi:hypothetical protein
MRDVCALHFCSPLPVLRKRARVRVILNANRLEDEPALAVM